MYHRQGANLSEPWTKVSDSEAIFDMRTATNFLSSSGATLPVLSDSASKEGSHF